MTDIKLSICIPTFNRARFLEHLLGTLADKAGTDLSHEIVISDNASTDDTTAVVERFIAEGLPIRYLRRNTNGGGWPNLANAFGHARGEYALYLADDDLLIWDNLKAVIDHLDENPDMVVCHAPWSLYDAIADKDGRLFYHVETPRRFPRWNFLALFSFITERHIFPEICVYRTEALRTIYVERHFCFWAFAFLAHAIDIGAVGFLDKPFYRSVTRTAIARGVQAGNEEAMHAWDRYKGGLEYLLYLGSLRKQIDLGPENKARFDRACTTLTLERMTVALRMWFSKKDFPKAYEVYARLCYNGFGHIPEVKDIGEKLPLMCAVQSLAHKVNAAPDIRLLALDGVTDIQSLAGLLFELGLDPRISVIAPPTEQVAAFVSHTAVFTADSSRRTHFEQQGFLPGLVFSEADIIGAFPI
ncbi:glycosyltransferase family 2 protein [Ciceribacter sp. L1K23]|uniref:glycosyltransferase family 2 protein n=1 Tax=Ciceribacter sp. L1K23 TaxID=2820276 RepID=UPI001B812921|nr:glycosyltransferase family 2 protein [Ciceribacter sp. L1K23]MBR0557904.1 glycosyltransferase family 2 protein [Ciceribacter sp. L1K23]